MVKIISLFVVAFLLVIGQCDLIGYNRLGNNVDSHARYRPGNEMGQKNYRFQILQWIMENNNLSVADKKIWLQKLGPSTRTTRPNSRLRGYTQSMGSI